MMKQVSPIRLSATVVAGFGRGGKQLGCPTANLSSDDLGELLHDIPTGIYCGWATVDGQGPFKAVASVGWNPFFQNKEKTIEPHLLHEFKADFYGAKLNLVLCAYLRPEENFPSLDALIDAIQSDISLSREWLDCDQGQAIKEDELLRPTLCYFSTWIHVCLPLSNEHRRHQPQMFDVGWGETHPASLFSRMATATRVLTDAHLGRVLFSYQRGIYAALRPIFAHRQDLLHGTWRRLRLYQKHVGCLHDPRAILLLLVQSNRVDLVDKLLRCSIPSSSSVVPLLRVEAMDTAAALGHLAMLVFLHVHHVGQCTTSAMDQAAANGHFDVVQWLHLHRHEGCTTRAMDLAARHGHLEIVKFLHVHREEGEMSFGGCWLIGLRTAAPPTLWCIRLTQPSCLY
ncbi:Aste57867_10151 [Aphanomyces stellatus]|uniref:riboflavin kinase n=1 Tax=Aphanomyces stellatus TaxID=120398 RepID=A0A485KPM5_9STRA|nr:hypothetical protein As57867_010112 [Aphanomyces stellatus]VFT87027.1 Aste57867_10151 [Aphanomyces stellatus]